MEFEKYPIVLTRDIEKARRWLRDNTRGNERSGVRPHVLQSDEQQAYYLHQ